MEEYIYRDIVNSDMLDINLPNFLKHREVEIIVLPYAEKNKKLNTRKKLENNFTKLCGLWENRDDITQEDLREKAWLRK